MLKILFLLSAFLGFSEEIEVRLKTASELKNLSLSMEHELRSVLEFDLNCGGFVSVVGPNERAPYSIQVEFKGGVFEVNALNNERGIKKRYSNIPIDRGGLHRLADTIHKDFFGIEGIASLRLLYSKRESTPSGFVSEIYLSDSDGENSERLTFENDYCVSPSFYPNSDRSDPPFFYVSYKQGQSKIFRSTIKSKKSEIALELRGSQVLPAIDREGIQMALISDAAGRPDLFLHSLGKTRQLFTAPRATQASPTFSPDGRKIAFVSDKDGSPRVYLLDLHQIRPTLRLLTKRNRENTSPSWSPDGKKLAYSAKIDGVRQIWIYDFGTEEETALTTGGVNKENPSWAPDSLHLVYNTENEDQGDLFLIDLKQKTPVQITKGEGQKRFPSWESRGTARYYYPASQIGDNWR